MCYGMYELPLLLVQQQLYFLQFNVLHVLEGD